jgi:hypothetical protein
MEKKIDEKIYEYGLNTYKTLEFGVYTYFCAKCLYLTL